MKTICQVVTLVSAVLVSSSVFASEHKDIKQQISEINGQVRSLPADTVVQQSKCDTLACELSDAGISFIMPSDHSRVTVFSEKDGVAACKLLKTIAYQASVVFDGKVVCD